MKKIKRKAKPIVEGIFCWICNKGPYHQLTGHLQHKHNITNKEYKKRFPDAPLISEQRRNKMKEHWNDPKYRNHMTNFMKTNNPMFDPKNKEIHWKSTHTKEFRETCSENSKELWANRTEKEKQKVIKKILENRDVEKVSRTLKATIAKMKKENLDEFKKKWNHSEGLRKKWQSYTPKERRKRIEDSMGFGRNSFMGRAKTGYFYSEKNKQKIFYRSSFELMAYQILEQIPHVVKYETECLHIPYVINGEKHTYIPDILVTYKDGSQSIIEVKPSWIVEEMDQKLSLKIESAKNYCNQRDNINFILLTEENLT